MSDNPLAKKLKLKSGQRIALVEAPAGYLDALRPLPEGVEVAAELAGPLDWAQVFLRTQADLERLAPALLAALGPATLLWIAFPKGSSKIQTDLTRDTGWEALAGAELKWLTLVSVDETWSAFAVRKHKPGEARQSFR